MTGDGDPDHPIIERPWEYEIVGLAYHRAPDTWADSYIDLILQRGERRRHLRFLGPRDLRIDEGFPSSSGLRILDVSGRQLDGIGVRVANFEPDGGCPTFLGVQSRGPGGRRSHLTRAAADPARRGGFR